MAQNDLRKSRALLRWPFRFLGIVVGVVAIAGWTKLVFLLVTFSPTEYPLIADIFAVVSAPLLVLFFTVPAIYGYYPQWIAAWLPKSARRFMQARAVDVFTDWPWKRNPRMKNFFSADRDSSE